MKHFIVGTAGHIDHGKTALVKALTGTDPDRLKEEQERGITIDIGFAFLTLPSGIEAGIIDVPGHEKFVKNMLAGVGGIDLAILVVAADEGVMPQTEEHLSICNLLQIQRGLVALTKSDLVDEEWLAVVTEDVRAELAGTFLQDAPIVPVSSKTGAGLDRLLAELDQLASQVQERSSEGVFRLPIDRVFSIKGFGTVVTGTMISGSIKTEDVVELLPANITTRVRTIQVHETTVPVAYAGQRTALNLHGTERNTIQRGDVLSEPDLLQPTYMLDAYLTLLPKVAKPLKNRSRVRFHHGTSEILARVVLLERAELTPGISTYMQFHLEAPLVAMARDRYILRSYSPVLTIGGGEIVYVHPQKHKRSSDILKQMRTLREGTLDQVVEVYVAQSRFHPITPRAIAGVLAVSPHEIARSLQQLIRQKVIINIAEQGIAAIHVTQYRALSTMLVQAIEEFHQKFPLKPGMAKEELRKKLPIDLSLQVFQHLLDGQVNAGHIEVEQNTVKKQTHRLILSATQSTLKQQLEKVYLANRFQPPNRKDALDRIKTSDKEREEIFRLLVDEGTLIRVDNDLYYHQETLKEIMHRVIEHLKQHTEMMVGDVKTLFQVSRKYAVPLLAYLDAAGITIRKGDARILRVKNVEC
jgi:selenocysteine-specific elongation factor